MLLDAKQRPICHSTAFLRKNIWNTNLRQPTSHSSRLQGGFAMACFSSNSLLFISSFNCSLSACVAGPTSPIQERRLLGIRSRTEYSYREDQVDKQADDLALQGDRLQAQFF